MKQIGFYKQILLILLSLSIICIGLVGFVGFTVTNRLNTSLVMNSVQSLTDSTCNLIDSAVNVSIRNHLRAIAEQNLEIVRMYYQRYESGELTETEAKKEVERILLGQKVGDTGYIYVVDSNGVLKVHPELKGENLAGYDFIGKQIELKKGYIEYSWKNPLDKKAREKALYMSYFEPWVYIISISSYRDEFVKLVNIQDFKNNILSNKVGESGYMFVLNSKGDLIIHPKLEGTNILSSTDPEGRYFIREMIDNKNGSIIYPWKNPGESHPRNKIVIYRHYVPMDWYICSGVYIDELVQPIKLMEKRLAVTSFFILLFAILISFVSSRMLLRPITRLIRAAEGVIAGNFDVKIENNRRDEIGKLTDIFNEMVLKIKQFMENLRTTNRELEEINISLEQKVCERTRQLELLSSQDGLTGIANRRKMDEYLEHEWNLSARLNLPLSLILLDIDFFKNFNDTYGHPSGDECLKKVAASLSSSLHRMTDFCARYGGEEFVAILSNTDKIGAYGIAERIRSDIEQLNISHRSSAISDHVTVSLGVCAVTDFQGKNPQGFIQSADGALYASKQNGRNSTVSVNY